MFEEQKTLKDTFLERFYMVLSGITELFPLCRSKRGFVYCHQD